MPYLFAPLVRRSGHCFEANLLLSSQIRNRLKRSNIIQISASLGSKSPKRRRFKMTDFSDILCGRTWEFTEAGSSFFTNPATFKGVEFSVMSYNILAQNLLEDNRYLYQSVDPRSLDWEHRRYRLLLELRFYNPHVVCMQEVKQQHLSDELSEVFASMGYGMVYQSRTGDKQDGCLIMYKKQCFKLVTERKVKFYRKGVATLDRDNVGLIVVLSPVTRPELKVCIATTHLLFNPKRGDIKLAQLALLLAEINSCVGKNNSSTPCILCGDFNSAPFSPLYNFITQGALDYTKFTGPQISAQERHSSSYASLIKSPLVPSVVGLQDDCQYAADNEECSAVTPMGSILMHRLGLVSVYSHTSLRYPQVAEVTSFHDRSEETLDYLFYTSRHSTMKGAVALTPLCRLGLLTGNQLKSRGGLPNKLQPSDHLPLMCSFLLSKNE